MKNLQDLVNEMNYLGLYPNINKIRTDGEIMRFPTKGKPHKKNGWGVIYLHGDLINAVFGDFQLQEKHSWCNKAKLNAKEKIIIYEQYKDAIEKIEAEKIRNLKLFISYYNKNVRKLINPHRYMITKKINNILKMSISNNLGTDRFGNLIIPIRSIESELMGIQKINKNGNKWFNKGAYKHGNFFNIIASGLLINDCDTIFIGEGFSTMASVYLSQNNYFETANYCCIVAFDVNNIEPVLINVWNKYGNKNIVLVADNDRENEINVGVKKCTEIKAKYPHKSIIVYIPEEF